MKEYDLLSFQHIIASNMAMKHETTIIKDPMEPEKSVARMGTWRSSWPRIAANPIDHGFIF
ncbi:hypothetical protein EEL52_10450 [Muribaculaceae bacterium Isolate-113 (HZI)]|nr:hypothetical protein EEL53_10860 [Muribaculaceae bacterium Isolate-114 (HZI)]ROT20415.1 hypothetical protein EEL52_10450 [Muribaculaceae bacterium Isolate-113 (HZI)]